MNELIIFSKLASDTALRNIKNEKSVKIIKLFLYLHLILQKKTTPFQSLIKKTPESLGLNTQ